VLLPQRIDNSRSLSLVPCLRFFAASIIGLHPAHGRNHGDAAALLRRLRDNLRSWAMQAASPTDVPRISSPVAAFHLV